MAEDWWKDATVRARKVEGGYESIFDLDGEELVVNYFSFDAMARILEEALGKKHTPEDVEEEVRTTAGDPEFALDTLPPLPRRGEEGLGEEGEIATNWNRVRTHLAGKPDLISDLVETLEDIAKQKEKEGISQD